MTAATQAPEANSRPRRLVHFAVFSLVRLFYPRIEIQGRDKLPAAGPLIFVLNHPNGLLDPMVLMIGLDRPVSFLAKSTLFGNPLGRFLMETFGALPVYRHKDEGKPGGPWGDAPERNEATFARCRALLRQGRAMALFPEGTTHSGTELLPLRTGAARIALSAEDEAGWTLGVQLVPVGLWYQNKTVFRTPVLLVVGEPFGLQAYAADYAADARQTVQAVTARIEAGLDRVVLQAENAELLAAIPVVAAWTAPDGTAPDLGQQHEWAATLLSTYKRLYQTDPARLEAIAKQARQYARALRMFGINDPWALELPTQANRRPVLWRLLLLVITFPLALAGFLLSYGPYRIVGPIATRAVGPYDTQISLVKLVGGSIFVLVGWIVEAMICGRLLGAFWGLLLFIVAPLLAYVALRWGETWRELYELASYEWLRLQHRDLVQALKARRQALARHVMEAVEAASA